MILYGITEDGRNFFGTLSEDGRLVIDGCLLEDGRVVSITLVYLLLKLLQAKEISMKLSHEKLLNMKLSQKQQKG